MHEFVVFVNLLGVGFTRESSKTLFEHIYLKRLIRCDKNIDSQVEFVTVNQQGIRYISRYD
jgi:hypothetical protein